MDLRARDAPYRQKRTHFFPVAFSLRKQNDSRGFEPGLDLVKRHVERGGRVVDSRMGHNRQEFVEARPRDGPWQLSLSEFGDALGGDGMPGRVRAVRVNEKVRINGDQAPCPS